MLAPKRRSKCFALKRDSEREREREMRKNQKKVGRGGSRDKIRRCSLVAKVGSMVSRNKLIGWSLLVAIAQWHVK